MDVNGTMPVFSILDRAAPAKMPPPIARYVDRVDTVKVRFTAAMRLPPFLRRARERRRLRPFTMRGRLKYLERRGRLYNPDLVTRMVGRMRRPEARAARFAFRRDLRRVFRAGGDAF